jgi:hypothetical protein
MNDSSGTRKSGDEIFYLDRKNNMAIGRIVDESTSPQGIYQYIMFNSKGGWGAIFEEEIMSKKEVAEYRIKRYLNA